MAGEAFDVFVSYARADDEAGRVATFVEELRLARAADRPWRVFFDRDAIRPGEEWERRLALVRDAGALVALLSPAYFASEWCRREWHEFRDRERIYPVYLTADPAFDDESARDPFRREVARRQFIDLRDRWDAGPLTCRAGLERLERVLSDALLTREMERRARRARAPYPSVPLPGHFVERPDELARLKVAVLAPESGRGVVVSAVFGLGGVGKSTLAARLIQESDVREHFADGILWATFGQTPEPRAILGQWVAALGDHEFRAAEPEAATAHLRALLQNRSVLLVIDDAWRAEDAERFLVGGESCRAVITTRDGVLSELLGARLLPLDLLTESQSISLLQKRVGRAFDQRGRASAQAAADAVGHLPLALELVAAQVADGATWEELIGDLGAEVARLESLDRPGADEVPESRRKKLSLTASLNLSLARLPTKPRDYRSRFAWLGVLPEDAAINPRMAATLWGTDERGAREGLLYLRNKALLLTGPTAPIAGQEVPTFRLHDLLHDAARRSLVGPPDDGGLGFDLPQAHAAFLSRYREKATAGRWHTVAPDGYVHARLTWHMEQAGDVASIHALLREQTPDRRNGWFEACEGLGEAAGFADDVARAWRCAQGRSGEALAFQLRYALLSATLNSLAANIPAELLAALVGQGVWPIDQALAYARLTPDAERRGWQLTKLLPMVKTGREGVCQEALSAALATRDEWKLARTLESLVPLLPEELLAGASLALVAIVSEWARYRVMSVVAPRMPDRAVRDLVTDLPPLGDGWGRSATLAALAPRLAGRGLAAKAVAAARSDSPSWSHSWAMAHLAPYLSPKERGIAVREALAAARGLTGRDLALALATLSPLLAEAERPAAWREAIEAARTLGGGWECARTLADLAPSAPEECLAEILAGVEGLRDEGFHADAFAALAPRLNGDLLRRAIQAASSIPDARHRADAVAALSGGMSDQALRRALSAVRAVGDGLHLAKSLVALAPLAPAPLGRPALDAVLTIEDERERGRSLGDLAPHLTGEPMDIAVSATLRLSDEWAKFCAFYGLAACVPDPRLSEVLAAVRAITGDWPRAGSLTRLAPRVPEVADEALASARRIPGGWERAEQLARTASVLPPEGRRVVLEEALAAARSLQGWKRPRALASVVPHLPESERGETLREALIATRSLWFWERAEGLAVLCRSLPAEEKAAVLRGALIEVLAVIDEGDMAKSLAALAPDLPEAYLPELRDAAARVEGAGAKLDILIALSARLASSRPDEALLLWNAILAMASKGVRGDFTSRLPELVAVMASLAGTEAESAATSAAEALIEIGRWFP